MGKTCSKCKETKEFSAFHKDKQKSDGLYSSCKDCERDEWTSKEYREKRKHPRYALIKRRHKVKQYGLTLEQYEQLRKDHNDCCAICNQSQSERTKLLHIDHSHKTGKVRGLLCDNCNMGLGSFKDNPELLRKAIEYVIQSA